MKIAIMGFSGSGKSTLARELGERYDIPVLHLDRVQFLPGWEIRDREEAKAMVARFHDENNSWVIEGNYQNFHQERRLEEADRILLLQFPRRICFPRVLRRIWHHRGKSRPDMADGCNERLDLEFLWWVLSKGRGPKNHKRQEEICEQYFHKAVILRNPNEVRHYIQSLFQQAQDTVGEESL